MVEDTSFRRSEKKFIVLEHTFDEILEDLEKHIPIHSFQTEYPLSLIETIYMEDKSNESNIFLCLSIHGRTSNFSTLLERAAFENCS